MDFIELLSNILLTYLESSSAGGVVNTDDDSLMINES